MTDAPAARRHAHRVVLVGAIERRRVRAHLAAMLSTLSRP
jgi:hypothetical protein